MYKKSSYKVKNDHMYREKPPSIVIMGFMAGMLSATVADYTAYTYRLSMGVLSILYFVPVLAFLYIVWGIIASTKEPQMKRYAMPYRIISVVAGIVFVCVVAACLNGLFHMFIQSVGRG